MPLPPTGEQIILAYILRLSIHSVPTFKTFLNLIWNLDTLVPMPVTAPIRVGIIGLSRPGGWATIAHLPYLQQTSKYQIVAIANSSVESAQRAIENYGLSKDTKAYGSPEGECPLHLTYPTIINSMSILHRLWESELSLNTDLPLTT